MIIGYLVTAIQARNYYHRDFLPKITTVYNYFDY